MDNVEEITTQHIEYTRTVVPSTMRSPYWKFFGFPSDNSNNVLTKQKIICTLCNAVIAYNKNTSNLRTHIVARHPELLMELYNEKHKKNSEAPVPTSLLHVKNEPPAKRAKTTFVINESVTNEPGTSDLKPYNETIIEMSEVIDQADDKAADNCDYDDFSGSITHNTEYGFEEIEHSPSKATVPPDDDINVEDHVIEMLITDLHPPSLLSEPGFTQFTGSVATKLVRRNEIEQKIDRIYNKRFNQIHENLKTITNTTPYSLSIESYQNIENRIMVSIYLNHLMAAESRLQSTAYTTVESTTNTDYAIIFSGFNLTNCSAAMMSEENEQIEQFFSSHGVPITPCFESVINNCMMSIFAHSAVNRAYKKTLELFEKHDCASMLESIPEIFEENPWSKFNFLQFVQDHLSIFDEENSEAIDISKQLVTFLSPLKTTLETIADEPLALCSLMVPLSRKLIDEYFSNHFCETEALTDVKNIVIEELSQRILSNMFLSEASFLDPRFQSVTIDMENLQEIKDSIIQRFEDIATNNDAEQKTVKSEIKSTTRKSSLKLFFNRGAPQETKNVNIMKRSLEYEINKYIGENEVDLEQCPLKWWEENEFSFRKLRKISDYYLCVPCYGTNLFKYSLCDRVSFTNRRFMLRKNVANQMLFLHLNKDILDRLKVEERSVK